MARIEQSTMTSFKNEPSELADLVLKKADHAGGEEFDEFVRHRYWRPFDHSVRWSSRYSFAFSALTILVIAGGVASSVLASLPNHHANTAIAILGILVAVTASVNRLWRPGARAALRHRTANSLRREGWSFVCGQGRYRKCERDPIDVFFEEVERINLPAESIDEQEMEGEAR